MVPSEHPTSSTPTPEEIGALRDLLEFGTKLVAAHLSADGEPDFRALIVAFFSRATATSQAVALLVEEDFGQQAMMLNRAAFELMLDSYWIENNRELATERFVQHARFQQQLERETAERYPALVELEIPEERLGDTELAELAKLYGPYGGRSWTGLSVHQRVEDVVGSFEDDASGEQLRSFRDVIHRLHNQELHPTAWSLGRVLCRRSEHDGGEVLQYRLSSEPELGLIAVRCAWWMYLQVLHLLIEIFEMPIADKLERLKGEAPWDDQVVEP